MKLMVARRVGCVACLGLAIALVAGCKSSPISQVFKPKAPAQPTELGTVAQIDEATTPTGRVVGVVVQAILMGDTTDPIATDGTFSFFAYFEGEHSNKVEPDRRWSFTQAQVAQAKTSASFGDAYSFWLPIGGRTPATARIRLVTTFVSAAGMKLVSQAVVSDRAPASIIEQKTLKNAEPKREPTAQGAQAAPAPADAPGTSTSPSVSTPSPEVGDPTAVAGAWKKKKSRLPMFSEPKPPRATRGTMSTGPIEETVGDPEQTGPHGKHRFKRAPAPSFPANAM